VVKEEGPRGPLFFVFHGKNRSQQYWRNRHNFFYDSFSPREAAHQTPKRSHPQVR